MHPVLPARIGHEGWGARTSEELSVGSFVCEYAGAMTIPGTSFWLQQLINIQIVKMRRSLVVSHIFLTRSLGNWSNLTKQNSCWLVQPPTRRPFVASDFANARWGAPRCWSWDFGCRAWCVARLRGTDNAGCEKTDVYTGNEDKTSIQTLGLESCNGI